MPLLTKQTLERDASKYVHLKQFERISPLAAAASGDFGGLQVSPHYGNKMTLLNCLMQPGQFRWTNSIFKEAAVLFMNKAPTPMPNC